MHVQALTKVGSHHKIKVLRFVLGFLSANGALMLFSDPFGQAFLVELVVFTLHVFEVD